MSWGALPSSGLPSIQAADGGQLLGHGEIRTRNPQFGRRTPLLYMKMQRDQLGDHSFKHER